MKSYKKEPFLFLPSDIVIGVPWKFGGRGRRFHDNLMNIVIQSCKLLQCKEKIIL